MTMAGAPGYRPGLVNTKTGQISREIFVNEAIYAEEQERIFARAWLFIGHESQIPSPGDYAAARMGGWSACRSSARPITRPWIVRNGGLSRSRSWPATRARSGPPGMRRRRL